MRGNRAARLTADGYHRCVLITDRRPTPSISPGAFDLVLPIGDSGHLDTNLAQEWSSAGLAVPSTNDAYSRTVFAPDESIYRIRPREEADRGWSVIQDQLHAVLTPGWPELVAVMRQHVSADDNLVVRVRCEFRGAVEVGAAAVGACVSSVSSCWRSMVRYSRTAFLLGEVLGKAVAARGRVSSRRCSVIVYAEVQNHWRQLAPVVEALRRCELDVLFANAAVRSFRPYIPEGILPEDTISLDRRCCLPRPMGALIAALVSVRRPVVEGSMSRVSMRFVARKARYLRWVYAKGYASCIGLRAITALFGDCSAHRPAGVAHSFGDQGATTFTMQHGAVVDARRYLECTDYMFAWDERSAHILVESGMQAQPLVVGVPTVGALAQRMHRVADGVLVAPTWRQSSASADWLSDVLAGFPRGAFSRIRIRLHPAAGAQAEVAQVVGKFVEVGALLDDGTLDDALLSASVVVTDSHSVREEARLLGLPVVWGGTDSVELGELATRALALARRSPTEMTNRSVLVIENDGQPASRAAEWICRAIETSTAL